MVRKKKIEYHSYTEGTVRYMSCMTCGNYEVVGESATGVKCSNCVMKTMMNQHTQEEKLEQNEDLAKLRADTSIEKTILSKTLPSTDKMMPSVDIERYRGKNR